MPADSRPERAVPFSLMGPDLVLRFTTADLVTLSQTYKTKDRLWHDEIEHRLNELDSELIADALKLGLKGPGGFDRPTGLDFKDLPFGLVEAVRPLADAIACAITGRSYASLVQERDAASSAASAE